MAERDPLYEQVLSDLGHKQGYRQVDQVTTAQARRMLGFVDRSRKAAEDAGKVLLAHEREMAELLPRHTARAGR